MLKIYVLFYTLNNYFQAFKLKLSGEDLVQNSNINTELKVIPFSIFMRNYSYEIGTWNMAFERRCLDVKPTLKRRRNNVVLTSCAVLVKVSLENDFYFYQYLFILI